jgi:small multidrug resistance pump
VSYVFLILALTLNATANVLMKVGANRLATSGARETLSSAATNLYLVGGLGLFALNILFYIAALRKLDLSFAYPVMTAGSLLLVVLVSVLALKERITALESVGILLMLAGLALVSQRGGA